MSTIRRFEQFSTAISNIYKIMQKIERDGMARLGLRGPHAQCIVALLRNPDGLPLTALCEICEKDKSAISRAVAELEAKGLVRRDITPEKAYRVPVMLTDEGHRLGLQIRTTVEFATMEAGLGLTEIERMYMHNALDKIESNLRRINEDGLQQLPPKG